MRFDVYSIIQVDKKGRRILKWNTFSNLKDKDAWDCLLSAELLELNLKDINIFSHDGIIWLAFILLFRSKNNLQTYVILPEEENHIKFLKYVGFHEFQRRLSYSFLNEYLLHSDALQYEVKDEYKMSIRKLQFVNGNNWSNIANTTIHDIRTYLIDKLNLSPIGDQAYEMVFPFITTMQEILHNIALHGGSRDGCGIGFISFTPLPTEINAVRYCFSDIGNGFRATLRDKHSIECKTDDKAVFKALLFRYNFPAEGILGLYPTLKFIRRRKGSISIRSGGVVVKINFRLHGTQKSFDGLDDKPTIKWLKSLSTVSKGRQIPGTHILVDLGLAD